jgi:hypothetical protein
MRRSVCEILWAGCPMKAIFRVDALVFSRLLCWAFRLAATMLPVRYRHATCPVVAR